MGVRRTARPARHPRSPASAPSVAPSRRLSRYVRPPAATTITKRLRHSQLRSLRPRRRPKPILAPLLAIRFDKFPVISDKSNVAPLLFRDARGPRVRRVSSPQLLTNVFVRKLTIKISEGIKNINKVYN